MDYLSQAQMRANIAQTQAQSALLDAQRKVLEHDYQTYFKVPGQTSKDHGTIPLLTRTFYEGAELFREKVAELKKTDPELADTLFPGVNTSKPASSATLQEYKKYRGVSPDVLAWKEKLLSLGTHQKTIGPKGGGRGGGW